MTIRQLRHNHPDLFHPNQDWFSDEPFMDEELPDGVEIHLSGVVTYSGVPPEFLTWELIDALPAVVLVHLYVEDPKALIFRNYLWTSTKDKLGQRVYVGCNGRGLEIHRYLAITHRFGVPLWE